MFAHLPVVGKLQVLPLLVVYSQVEKGEIMKKLFIFCFLLLPLSVWGYIGSGIVINEVQPSGDGSSSSPDWIELYNNSDSTINIWDWIISDQDTVAWDDVDPTAPNCSDATASAPGNYTDCDYRIPSDPNLTDELDVAPGCYVVIYNTSGTNDYSCSGDNKIVLYMNRDGDDIWSSVADDVILVQRFGQGTAVYNTYGTTLYLETDYVAWDTGFGAPDPHPTKCGSNSNQSYPDFKVYASDDTDAQNQCSDATSLADIPYVFPENDSSRAMAPITQSLSSTYSRNPNGTDTDSASDFVVATDTPGTTVKLIEQFSVIPKGSDTLLVKWQTGFEKELVGFNVLESDSPDGRYIRRNAVTIKAKGIHSTYTIILRVLNPAPVLYYKLEVVKANGKSEFFGPVAVSFSGSGKSNTNISGNTNLTPSAGKVEGETSGCSHYPIEGVVLLFFMVGLFLLVYRFVINRR